MNPDSAKNYYSFYVQDVYVGFVNILEEKKEVFIGIGTKPACCNHGYGQQMLQTAYENSKKLYSAKPLYLEAINEQIQNIAQKKDTLCRRMYN